MKFFAVVLVAITCVSLVVSGKLIYHQTMTPYWLEAHASYIDSARSTTTGQMTFNAGSVPNAALLKVPVIPPSVVKYSIPLTIEITVAHDINIGKTKDSDIRYGVSDGTRFVGFQTWDSQNYGYMSPCHGVEGASGSKLSSIKTSSYKPKPTDRFYPGQFVFTIMPNARWGSCYTAHDGGFTRETGYENGLMLSKGLNLEVYKTDKGESVGIKYIKVAIYEDE